MSKDVAEFSFPGMGLFNEKQAERLAKLVQHISGSQPQIVSQICEEHSVGGWLPSGFPDYSGLARVERVVKTKGCAFIAYETARMMGADLSSEGIPGLIEEGRYVYEYIPKAVFNHLQQ